LTVSLERLGQLVRAHQEALSVEVARVEEAIGALADPGSVAEAMEGARAEAARQVAEADERAVHDRQARSAAEAAEHDATEAANAAWERVEALEVELAAATDEVGSLRAALEGERQQHASELAAVASAHAAELSAARSGYEKGLAEAPPPVLGRRGRRIN